MVHHVQHGPLVFTLQGHRDSFWNRHPNWVIVLSSMGPVTANIFSWLNLWTRSHVPGIHFHFQRKWDWFSARAILFSTETGKLCLKQKWGFIYAACCPASHLVPLISVPHNTCNVGALGASERLLWKQPVSTRLHFSLKMISEVSSQFRWIAIGVGNILSQGEWLKAVDLKWKKFLTSLKILLHLRLRWRS